MSPFAKNWEEKTVYDRRGGFHGELKFRFDRVTVRFANAEHAREFRARYDKHFQQKAARVTMYLMIAGLVAGLFLLFNLLEARARYR